MVSRTAKYYHTHPEARKKKSKDIAFMLKIF